MLISVRSQNKRFPPPLSLQRADTDRSDGQQLSDQQEEAESEELLKEHALSLYLTYKGVRVLSLVVD